MSAPDTQKDRMAETIMMQDAEIARLTAERGAAMAGLVKVKPLVWGESAFKGSEQALTSLACYLINKGTGFSFTLFGVRGTTYQTFKRIEAAKSAAQADYEARILAAIQPDTERAERVARTVESAPKDGTLIRLLVDYRSDDAAGALEDAAEAWTIGFNNLRDTGDDEWQLAGWNWSQDCFSEGHGKVIGWLPFHGPAPQAREITVQEAAEVPSAWDLARVLWEARKYAAWGKDAGSKLIERTPWQKHPAHPLVTMEHELAHAEAKAAIAAMQKGG